MGQKLSHHISLLIPRPSIQKIRQAANKFRSTTNTESNDNDANTNTTEPTPAIQLIIVDVQTGNQVPAFVKRDARLISVLEYHAQTATIPVTELQLNVNGEDLADEEKTVAELDLQPGDKLKILRTAPSARRPIYQWVDRDGIERIEDEDSMRALLRKRFDKKCKIARETFGYE